MVLDLFFVATDLALDLLQRQVDCRIQIRMGLACHQVVLVFRLDDELDMIGSLLEIDRHLDERNAVEKVQQLLGLVANELLMGVAEVTVACGDFNLHSKGSFVPSKQGLP